MVRAGKVKLIKMVKVKQGCKTEVVTHVYPLIKELLVQQTSWYLTSTMHIGLALCVPAQRFALPFVFAGEDSKFDAEEIRDMIIWRALLARTIWESFPKRPHLCFTLLITFNDADFQKLMHNETDSDDSDDSDNENHDKDQ